MASSVLLGAGGGIEEIFDRLDTDESGKLDFYELQRLVQASGENITDDDLNTTEADDLNHIVPTIRGAVSTERILICYQES